MDQFYRQGLEEGLVVVVVIILVLDTREQLAHNRAAAVAVAAVGLLLAGLAVLAAQVFAIFGGFHNESA